MKKFKRILLLLVTIVAGVIYFAEELGSVLNEIEKDLYVCVSPVPSTGYAGAYYYDYATIGKLADKVILMAYDYETRDMSQFVGTNYYYKTAATTPIQDVYLGLRIITEQVDMTIFVMRAGLMDKRILPVIEELYKSKKYSHMTMILNNVNIQYKKYGYGRSGYGYGYGYGY